MYGDRKMLTIVPTTSEAQFARTFHTERRQVVGDWTVTTTVIRG
jgi:hypothetical protein